MRLIAYDLTLALIRSLRPTIATIARHDARIVKQLRHALSSIAQNTAEAMGRFGGDRRHLFHCALGSLREVSAILESAEAFGWFAEAPFAAERDRLGGLLYGLQRK